MSTTWSTAGCRQRELGPVLAHWPQDQKRTGSNRIRPASQITADTTGWANNNLINGQSSFNGPGVIQPQVRIFYSALLPFFFNSDPGTLDDEFQFGSFVWGSFDGSTNAPVIFPNFLSVRDLQNFVLGIGPNP